MKVISTVLRLLFIPLLITTLIPLTGCKPRQKKPEEKKPPLVEVLPVRQGLIARQIEFTGSIEAETEVMVFPKITAAITDIRADMGDSVEKDEIIAVLESNELEAQLTQARAAHEVVRAKWAQMETGARPEEISQAKDLIIKARASLKEAESSYKRMKVMYEEGSISEKQFDTTELAFTVAAADLNSAEQRYNMLITGATKEDREALQAQIKQAKAAVELSKIRLSYTQIKSPLKGIISKRAFELGDLAMPGKPMFTIVKMDRVKVAIAYSGNSARFMVPGTSAQIFIPAYSDEQFTGKIDKVSPTLNPETRLFNAEIMLDNENYQLRPGMFAKVIFSIDPHPNALLIPKSSVIYRAGNIEAESMEAAETAQSTYVFVIQDGIAHMREVTLGHVTETEVEIRSGLEPDDEVVTLGLHKIKEGDKVSIVGQESSMGGNTH